MSDVTQILCAVEAGDPAATGKLMPLVSDELRKLAKSRMAKERPDHTLQATALVHDAYVRLVGATSGSEWKNRGHLFAAAAEAMRRILVDSARAKKSQKRGGDRQRLDLQDYVDSDSSSPALILDLNEGLSRLADEDAVSAELVKLRLFAGLSVTEAGQALGMSRTIAYENWEFARAWFLMHLGTPIS